MAPGEDNTVGGVLSYNKILEIYLMTLMTKHELARALILKRMSEDGSRKI
jgi:hypothetical protein